MAHRFVDMTRILIALAVAPTLGFITVIHVYYHIDPIEKPADGVEGYLFLAALPLAYLFALVVSWPLAHRIRKLRSAYVWIPLAGGIVPALVGIVQLDPRLAGYLFLFGMLTTTGFWLIGLAGRTTNGPWNASETS